MCERGCVWERGCVYCACVREGVCEREGVWVRGRGKWRGGAGRETLEWILFRRPTLEHARHHTRAPYWSMQESSALLYATQDHSAERQFSITNPQTFFTTCRYWAECTSRSELSGIEWRACPALTDPSTRSLQIDPNDICQMRRWIVRPAAINRQSVKTPQLVFSLIRSCNDSRKHKTRVCRVIKYCYTDI